MSNNEKKRENGQGNAEGLPKIETQEALVKKIQGNPGLRLDQIISSDDFASLFPNVNYLKHFQARFPEYLKLVIEYILASDIHFSRIFTWHVHLTIFTEGLFSLYIDQLIERLLTNEADFARLFTNHTQFREFAKAAYAERARVLSTFPLPKPEAKGPEGREVKRQSYAGGTPSGDRFSSTFSGTTVGVGAALTGFLDNSNLSGLSLVNRGAQKIAGEALYERRIEKEIGNPKALKAPTETFKAAYLRNREIIRSLPLINTQEELQKIRVTYPNYYFDRINVIGKEGIRRLFSDFKEAPRLKAFYNAFPAYADRVVEHLLIDDEFFIFVIHDWCAVSIFLRAFPRYASRVMERMLANEAHFANVFWHMNGLIGFCDGVPSEYANKVAEHILASDALFSRVFFSLAPDCGLPMFRKRFPAYADRAEALFKAKQQARQEGTKSVGLTAGGSIHQTASSSSSTTTSSYRPSGPSMFSSSSSVTTGSQQGQSPVEEANAVGLPAGDNGEASIQTSSGSLRVDLPDGDASEDEEPDRSPPDSPRGSS